MITTVTFCIDIISKEKFCGSFETMYYTQLWNHDVLISLLCLIPGQSMIGITVTTDMTARGRLKSLDQQIIFSHVLLKIHRWKIPASLSYWYSLHSQDVPSGYTTSE